MRHSASRGWLCLLLFLLAERAVGAPANEAPPFLQGPWRSQEGEEIVLIESRRLVFSREGDLRALGVLSYEKEHLTVRHAGLPERWRVVIEDNNLRLERRPGEIRFYRRLDSVPDAVRLDPLPLGPAMPLSAERVSAIQVDLAGRLREDQNALKNASLKPEEVDSIVEKNSQFLSLLVKEVGWIDTNRFGSKASYAAVILAKHGGDLRLLLAALPFVERDFKEAGDDAQAFAIVYDAVQLDLGQKQRFGTQIRGVGEGKPFVLPLEDPDRVDEYRKAIGLPPLAAYLSEAGKVLQMEISMAPEQ